MFDMGLRSSNAPLTNWVQRKLSDLGEIVGGTTPSRAVSAYWGGDTPWLTPGELTNLRSKYIHQTRDYVTRAGVESVSLKNLPPETVLITTRASVGSVALAGVPLTINQGFRALIPNGSINPDFLYYLLPTLKTELIRRASGTTFLEISGRELGSITITIPEVPEQRRIAAILDTLDETIRKTEQVIAKLKQMKQGLLHDLLTKGIDENGELRDPERNPEQFKDSSLGRIPDSWCVLPVGAVASVITGSTPPASSEGVWGSALEFVTPGDISDDGTILPPERCLSNKGRVLASVIPPRSLLVVCIGSTIGKMAITEGVCATNQQVNAIIPHSDHEVEFLEAAMLVRLNAFQALAGRQAVPIVNRSRTLEFLIPVAQPSEQRRIALLLRSLNDRLQAEKQTLTKLHTLKQGLMDDLLTGRVRVPICEEVSS